jgi:predicted nucleic acid-binding protein
MSTPTVFLDVNVFMYAAGAPHPYKAACVRILADMETGALTAAINTEVLQELLYRYTLLASPKRAYSFAVRF